MDEVKVSLSLALFDVFIDFIDLMALLSYIINLSFQLA